MIYPSLGQVLIRQGWEAFLLDMRLNKFVRVASIPRPIPKVNNTWFGKDSFLPQKGALKGSAHREYCPPFLRPSAYKVRVGGVSPQCGIEQICEGGIGSSAHSQSKQYLIGERFTHTMVHPSLGQVLIKQRWEASLLMRLSKTLRIRPVPHAANSEENSTWLGFETKFPPTILNCKVFCTLW